MNDIGILWLIFIIVTLFISYYFSKNNFFARRLLYTTFLVVNFIYLLWRTSFTLPESGVLSLVLGALLLIAEWAGFSQSIVFTILSWSPFKRKEAVITAFEELPRVDIFIATYNEPTDLLRRTITACQLLEYPQNKLNIYVCDDGDRGEVRALSSHLGVHYIRRDDNTHAKAGNLNHAMTKTNGEIIVTMDADMVPKYNFLTRTIGYFTDSDVSFVQTPQVFYNADAFQYNLFYEDRITNEQDFFMRQLEQGKDRFNATMYVGSNALFRRTSLEAIGGFATGVITEDMATGMLLQTNNQKTVFVNETLAVGLSPETYADLLKQRDRWARGNIQVARKWNPLRLKGLSFMQKLLYLDGIHYWFFGIYKLIYLLAPLLFLVFSIYSIDTDLETLVIFWLPAFLSSQFAFRRIANSKRTTLWSHVYEVALAPFMAASVLGELILKKNFNFSVTRKGVQSQNRQILWRTTFPYVLLTIFSLIAIAMVNLHLFTSIEFYQSNDMLIINIFWIFYNLLAILVSLVISVERPRFRGAERSNVEISGYLISEFGTKYKCNIVDLSESGARIELVDTISEGQLDGGSLYLEIKEIPKLKVTKQWISQQANHNYMGVSFQALSQAQYAALISILFTHSKDIYSNQTYVNASLFYVFLRFLKHSRKTPKQLERQRMREKVKLKGKLSTSKNEMPVTLLDYSLNGCQIKSKKKLRKNQRVELEVNYHTKEKVKARVMWVQKRGGTYFVGLKYIHDTIELGA